MGIYTAEGLVKHAEKALALDTAYMWGGIMRRITPAYIAQLRRIYGTKAGTGYTDTRYRQLEELAESGYYGCDCVGLIKSYYWSGRPDGGTGSPKYGAAGFPDVNAGMMFSQARVKGSIDTLPERPGVILYCGSSPHVGIYAGNGNVIECTLSARGDGVVLSGLGDFGWEYWFECPYISYPGAAPAKPGTSFSAGDRVYIRSSARCYSGTGVAIPARFKGKSRVYTVSKAGEGRVLLKELFSWVDVSDISASAPDR